MKLPRIVAKRLYVSSVDPSIGKLVVVTDTQELLDANDLASPFRATSDWWLHKAERDGEVTTYDPPDGKPCQRVCCREET